MFWAKKHVDTEGRLLLAACDDKVLGEAYYEGDFSLEVPKAYFAEEEVNESELADLSGRASILHFVGAAVVDVAKKMHLVEDDNVKEVNGVPYAMCVKIPKI